MPEPPEAKMEGVDYDSGINGDFCGKKQKRQGK